MTIDERTRHDLFLRLEEVLGPQEATTLMEHLPPVGWADVATKQDLERLELRFDAKLQRELREQTRALALANVGTAVALGSLILAAAKL